METSLPNTMLPGIELVVGLILVVLLVRYEYLRRVADVRTGRQQVVVTGIIAAVTLIVFTGLVVRRVLSFLVF